MSFDTHVLNHLIQWQGEASIRECVILLLLVIPNDICLFICIFSGDMW